MPILVLLLVVPALAAGAAAARSRITRRSLGLAAALAGLAVASAAVTLGVPLEAEADRGRLAALPADARAVSGLLIAGALALAAVALGNARRIGSPAAGVASDPPPPPARLDRTGATLVVAGALLVLVGPHLTVVTAGALLAAVAAHVVARRWGTVVAFPVLPLLVAAGLGVVLYYANVIAGPVGLATDSLADVPFSASAAAMLAPFLALGAVGFFGFSPIRRLVPGAALAGIGVALLVRVGHVALRDGLSDWRTVLVPLGVAALWHAAVTRRLTAAVGALAWLGAVAVTGFGAAGAIWLAGAAALVALLVGSRPLMARHPAALALAGGTTGWGAVLVVDALLRAEVVYAMLAWLAVSVAIWRATQPLPSAGPSPAAAATGIDPLAAP